jgi:hypothetical protein
VRRFYRLPWCRVKSDRLLARKLLRRGNFTSKVHLQQRIESFIAYFNATMAKPFPWAMKGKPLVDDVLKRVGISGGIN